MIKLLFGYVFELYRFARMKVIVGLVLSVILGLLEGANILMLLPMLTLAGIGGNQTAGLGHAVEQYLNVSHIALPLVLTVYAGLNLGLAWLQRYNKVLKTKIRESFAAYIYIKLFRTVTYARWSFFLRVKKADIMYILFTELPRVITGAYSVLEMFAGVVMVLIQLGIAMAMAPYLTLMIMCCGLVLSVCLQYSIKRTRTMSATLSEYAGEIFSEITEHINGIKEVKSYGVEASQVKTFEDHWKKNGLLLVDLAKLNSRTSAIFKVGAVVFVSLFYYSAVTIFRCDPREMLVVFIIFIRLWPRFSGFQGFFQSIAMMLPALQAVHDLQTSCLAEAEKEHGAVQKAGKQINLRKGIRVSDVSFRYDVNHERFAVKQANFFIPAGTTTAIVGRSGAGKSTLADLLLGLISSEKGEIWIDNERLDDENIYSWRQSIGYVSQDAFLFNISIRDNLTWACPGATERDIWQALQKAAIDDFVRNLPEQLDSLVGDRGICLSGGERQRIVLARALLRKPVLLILDEATSALDAENEKRVQYAIETLRGSQTILIIAHRLSTVQNADQILVMEQGEIVERGSYRSLVSGENTRFKQLACL